MNRAAKRIGLRPPTGRVHFESMKPARDVLADQYLEMRGRILILAADIDRIQRADGGDAVLVDPRLSDLRDCVRELLSDQPGRAERVQFRLSDKTPPPTR